MDRPLRIGVNALYLIPGGVGGTEIYLRGLLTALAQIGPLSTSTSFSPIAKPAPILFQRRRISKPPRNRSALCRGPFALSGSRRDFRSTPCVFAWT